MRRRMLNMLFTCLMVGGMSGVAAAAPQGSTPGPDFSPPPQCFVIKNGALPTCEKNADGTWTVVYPTGHGNLDSGSGGHSTSRDIELAISIAALLGVGIIAWRTWITPRRNQRPGPLPTPAMLPTPASEPSEAPPPSPPAPPPATPSAPAATDGYFANRPSQPPPATGADYSPK